MADAFQPFDADGGLVFATHLPGSPSGLDRGLADWSRLTGDEEHPVWINFDRSRPHAQTWLRDEAGLPRAVTEALLAEETRPRAQQYGDGLLVILRGVNLNPGAEPDELIALRMWVDARRIITLRLNRFQTIADLRDAAAEGRAPASPGALLAAVAHGLALRLGPVVTNLEELVDDIEDGLLDDSISDNATWRSRLASVRRQAIAHRRYLVPQRDALLSLSTTRAECLDQTSRELIHGAADHLMRICESLEETRDRAAVTSEELRAQHEARLGRTLYLLTVVATIALPLSFATGLFGINVGGIPLSDSPSGFLVVCAVLAVLGIGEIALFRLLRWL